MTCFPVSAKILAAAIFPRSSVASGQTIKLATAILTSVRDKICGEMVVKYA
jgi:hypothetical protein